MDTTQTTPTYDHIAAWADAIVADGPHDALISTGGTSKPEPWTCVAASDDGALVMYPTKRGGRCYPVAECADPTSRTRECIISTAAMRNRLASDTKYADEHRNPARRETITQRQWTRTHPDYKCGNPADGTAKVMRLTDRGTVLVPVAVV